MDTTRTLYVPESWLGSLTGVGVYTYNADQRSLTRLKPYPFGAAALLFYEVAFIGVTGSWWVPVAPQSLHPLAWPDPIVPVEGEGPGIWTSAYGQSLCRSRDLMWWIPAQVEKTWPLIPATNQGSLTGSFPLTGPSGT